LKLKQIKIAGFKSFVDPTTIKFNDKLSAIVGPNGCGKSNIAEAVKWVLGSSSAKELRGSTMDDVIFYGSETRQAISRAHVELVFDNTENRAPEEWAKYAEISVKRIIEKEKGSTYLINNTVVRRKDVADLFLGTGLGGRGYAIIAQNSITQIVEAKPEDLRGFLEEAAGVSKYKERRKETEFRLRDTKENLSRVQDLIHEIKLQATKLKSQAETANRYHKQQENLKFNQAQVWALKKRTTNVSWELIKKKIEVQTLELDQFTAKLRGIESSVELARQEYSQTTDEINIVQAKFYEVNSIVSNAENALNNIKNNIERLTKSQSDSRQKIEELLLLEGELNIEAKENEGKIKAESNRLENQTKLNTEKQETFNSLDEKRKESLSKIEKARNERDVKSKELHEESLSKIEKARNERDVKSKELHEESLSKIEKARNERDVKSKELQETEIRISSLNDFINEDKSAANIDSWLDTSAIEKNQPIIDQINIKEGWDTAFGYFLEEHIHAYEVTNFDIGALNERPNKSIILINKNSHENSFKFNEKLISATSVVNAKDNHISNSLSEWLCNVYLSDQSEVVAHREVMNYGDMLILKNGDIYGKTYQIIRSKNGANVNVLARKKQLDELLSNLPLIKKSFEKANEELSQIQEESKSKEEEFANQANEELSQIQEESKSKEEEFANQANEELSQIQEESKSKEEEFANERNILFESDKLKQEIEFNIKLSTNKSRDLSEKIKNINSEKIDLEKIIEDTSAQLKDNSVESFESDLKIKIAEKEKSEEDLTAIREVLTTKEESLKTLESSRLEKQHSLSPLQEGLQEIKIEERESKIIFEQCCNELEKSSLNEDELLSKLSAEDSIEDIEEKCIKISEKIERLGPVNQAAIE
jgi:chromosome segregation protein